MPSGPTSRRRENILPRIEPARIGRWQPEQSTVNKPLAITAVLVILLAIGGSAALLGGKAPRRLGAGSPPVWTEVAWPFPLDQWGRGLAFRCKLGDCGSDVDLYLRAKIGFCNCASEIDDDEVDRVGDTGLVGGERTALGAGRPLGVHGMQGRSRGYEIRGSVTVKSALTVAFHDRCDIIVATVALGNHDPALQRDAVLDFLNSDLVLRWAETTLGL
jgi:hypothetical protein